MTDLQSRIVIPDYVLSQAAGGQAALLHLDREVYFELDEVGLRMWRALEVSGTIAGAAQTLHAVYDVSLETLQDDMLRLVGELREHGLIEVED